MTKLVYLQVLRAFAALSVAMLHAQHDAATLAERAGRVFAPITAFPWQAGVDVFFVVSGFIMVHASARLFGSPEARRLFLARRIARIVPVYWAVTTAYLAIALLVPAALNAEFIGWARILASYLFIPVPRPDGLVQPLYGLGWTLNYEMFFYALFALAIARPRREAVLGLSAALVGLVALGQAFGPLPQPLGFWSDPIILEFVYGMGLALLHGKGRRLGGAWRGLLGTSALAALAYFATAAPEWAAGFRFLAYGVPAAALVAAVALGPDRAEAGPLGRFGAALGDASYAVYLIHPFAIRAGRELVTRGGLGSMIGPWSFVTFALAASVAVALLLYRFFERPITAALRRWLKV